MVGSNGTTNNGAGHAINVGPCSHHPTGRSICPSGTRERSHIAYPRMWGPSSDHAGGIVQHVYGDAHVEGLTDGIDPNVYLWIITRNGGEAIPST